MEYSWYKSAALLSKRQLFPTKSNGSGGGSDGSDLDQEEISDFTGIRLRNSLMGTYMLVLVAFGVLSVSGSLLNVLEIYSIIRNRLYRDSTFGYFVNLALADIVKCIFVIPFSQTSLLIENWIFGSFLCYFLPILQDVPAHVSTLTILMIVFDRHLFLRNPDKTRLPEFVLSVATWFAAICIALPYPIYTTYIDLKEHANISEAEGAGICLFSVEKDLKEYTRFIFITMFVMPIGLVILIFVKIRQTLEAQDERIVIEGTEIRLRTSFRRCYKRHRINKGIFQSVDHTNDEEPPSIVARSSTPIEEQLTIKRRKSSVDPQTEEKGIQTYLISIFLTHIFCFGPLMLLSKVVQLNTQETYENSHYWDKLFIVLVWIGFVPTVINPVLVFSMIATRDDIRRLCNCICSKRDIFCGRNDASHAENISIEYISRPSAANTLSTDLDEEDIQAVVKF